MVVASALQEDVDVVGLSILSGAHLPLVSAIQNQMNKAGLSKPIFVGGIIPGDDAELLRRSGVTAVFGPGTPIQEIADTLRDFLSNNADSAQNSKKSSVKNANSAKGKSAKPAKPRRAKTPVKRAKTAKKIMSKKKSSAKPKARR
jgi:hypothetical protein